MKSGRHRIDQHREGSPSLNSARLAQAEDAFDPVVTMFTGGSETSLAPEYPESQRPLREVVRRLNAGLFVKGGEKVYRLAGAKVYHPLSEKGPRGALSVDLISRFFTLGKALDFVRYPQEMVFEPDEASFCFG